MLQQKCSLNLYLKWSQMACSRCVGVRKWTQCCTKKRWKAHHDDTHEALGYDPCQLVRRKFHWTSNSSRQHFRPPFLRYKTMNDTGLLQYSARMTKGCLRTIPYPILKYVVVSEDLFGFTIVLGKWSNLMSIICQRSGAAASIAQGLNSNFCKMLLR